MPLKRSDLLSSTYLTPIDLLYCENEEDEEPLPPSLINLEYTQIPFAFLEAKLADRLEEALTQRPTSIRSKFLLAKLPTNTELQADVVWPVARELLDVLEAEMESVLKRHSVFFWLHVYRRIGVMLSPSHEDKTDERTVALVREIVELAIIKHGKAVEAWEFAKSDTIGVDRILGGFYSEARASASGPDLDDIFGLIEDGFRKRPALVIQDFSEDDFVGIYYVEGIAYQYWRVTALMRTLGKGGRLKIGVDGDWRWVGPDELEFLIRSIDERTDSVPFQFSLVGVWFDETKSDKGTERLNAVLVCPRYNVERASVADFLSRLLGINIAVDAVTNFLPGLLDLQVYLKAHEFLSAPFKKVHGFTLEGLISTLWATGSMLMLPDELIFDRKLNEEKQCYAANLLNLLQRGYKTLKVPDDATAAEGLVERMKLMKWPLEVPVAEVQAVIRKLTLTPDVQNSIGLWSRGPRFLYIPAAHNHIAVDLQGIPAILATLFFRVAHNQSARGTIFEEEFKSALSARGYKLHSGELYTLNGSSRELDAAVRIGDSLLIFECVSVERPLDYEIGNPSTFSARQDRLDAKVTQALSLAEFLQANPKGKNYDFTGVEKFKPYVVSPFVEWIWNRSERLWLEDGTPRILSAWEAIRLLEKSGST
jgi:hypothetical protein